MSNNYLTGVCAHCGADYGLHRSEDENCPKNGRELPMHLWEKGERQQWEETTFKDSGEKKLEDAAPDLLQSLKHAMNIINALAPENLPDHDLVTVMRKEYETILKKAT